MNYYAPREMVGPDGKPSGIWHYTQMNDGVIWPVGYCSPWDLCPDCRGQSSIYAGMHDEDMRKRFEIEDCKTCMNRGHIKKENPCPGHASPKAAERHYKEYLLDTAMYDMKIKPGGPCEICEKHTDIAVGVGPGLMEMHLLCEEHRNHKGLDLVVEVYDSASSY